MGRAADLLAAMAHPARLAVLLHLHRLGPTAAGELGSILGIEQTAMSHHLRLLRERRLVNTERRGRSLLYRLLDAHVGHIVEDTLRHAEEEPAVPPARRAPGRPSRPR